MRFLNRGCEYSSFRFRCLTSAASESYVTHVFSSALFQGASIYAQIQFFKSKNISVYIWIVAKPEWTPHSSALSIWIYTLKLWAKYLLAYSAQASYRRLLNAVNKSLLANLLSCKILGNNLVYLQNGTLVNWEIWIKFPAGNLKAYVPFIFSLLLFAVHSENWSIAKGS